MKQGRTVLQAKRYGVFTCYPATPLGEAARKMVAEDISALVVVDAQTGALVGLLSRTDVLRAHLALDQWVEGLTQDYMSTTVITVQPDDLLGDVAQHLLQHQIHRVVVVRPEENGPPRPVAVVSAADLLYHLVKDTE